ncbi:MAG: hypothetical protein WBL87_04665, partial [Methanothrix sp.]
MRNPIDEFVLGDLLKEKKELNDSILKVSEYDNFSPQKLKKDLDDLNTVIRSKKNEYYILTIIFFSTIIAFI